MTITNALSFCLDITYLKRVYPNTDLTVYITKWSFLADRLESYQLSQKHIALLTSFCVQPITFRYGSKFDLDFLFDLVSNTKTFDTFRIHNNKIDHILISKTKKRTMVSLESKELDLHSFIHSQLSHPTNKYVLFGVSSKLKNYSDPQAYVVIHRNLKDAEIFDMVDVIEKEAVLDALDNDLEMLKLDKKMHRVCFKNEIKDKIAMANLEKLYVSDKVYDKMMANMARMGMDHSGFKVIRIDTTVSSFIENREKRILIYDGVVGITFY